MAQTARPLDEVLNDALGTFEAFRRLGFLPQHLFISYDGYSGARDGPRRAAL